MQERNRGELAAVSQERTARIRVLVFLFFDFPSVVVCSSKIEVFGIAAIGRGYNELERRRVIKTLLDAGVERMRELSERSWLCKGPDETKKLYHFLSLSTSTLFVRERLK